MERRSRRPSEAATRRDRCHADPPRQPWWSPHDHNPTRVATSLSKKPRPARRALVTADPVLGDKSGDVTPSPSPKTILLFRLSIQGRSGNRTVPALRLARPIDS